MRKSIHTLGLLLILSVVSLFGAQQKTVSFKPINFSKAEIMAIGNRIWYFESKMSIEKLTWWNKNEPFASMGIGHFIWYPCNQEVHYTQTFPALLDFLESNGIKIPEWLGKTNRCCPWKTREEFYKDINSSQMNELRNLLASTIELQTKFIIQRTSKALELILKSTQPKEHAHIKKQFQRVANNPTGLFAIIDYINFKGEGVNPEERHNGQGWGLLQVLQAMQGNEPGMKAVNEFVYCAKKILSKRVANAPKGSHDGQFLAGWKKRVNGYTQELKVNKKI